jgi:hypothetical protein
VVDFGAQGDGQTDDAPAIQDAIDAVSESGGVVVFPPSKTPYLIRSGLKIQASNVELRGFLAAIKFADRAMRGQIIDCIEIRGTPDEPIENVKVVGLTIDANYWNQPGSYNPRGIDIDDATNVTIDRVTIDRAFVGLSFGKGVSHSKAADCTVTRWHNDGFNASADGVSGSCHDIRFIRCRAVGSPDERAGGLPGNRNNAWEIEDGTLRVTLIDCVVERCGGNGFAVRNHGGWDSKVDSRQTTMIRCRADGVMGHGFYARGISDTITVSELKLIDCSSDSTCAFIKDIRGLTMRRCQFDGSVTIGPARDVSATLTSFAYLTVWSRTVGDPEDGGYATSVVLEDCLLGGHLEVYGDAEPIRRVQSLQAGQPRE